MFTINTYRGISLAQVKRQIRHGYAWLRQTKRRRWMVGFVTLPLLFFLVLNLVFPLPMDRLYPQASTVVLDREGEILRVFLAPDDMWRMETSLDRISPVLQQAVLTYEDQWFYAHPGINPVAIGRAISVNLQAGEIVQGGSTITMQVARMMEPKRRTVFNKLIEAFRAIQLEWRFSKAEILTRYLNMAPYGGNIVGVGAAAQLYFNKRPDQLSLGEAALLTSIPNNPNLLRPDVDPAATAQAREKILKLLLREDLITEAQYAEAQSESIPQTRFALPFEAPHLAVHLRQQYPQSTTLTTTIDARLQTLAENLLALHLNPLRGRGIHNGAIVILDNETQGVRALVGSADFFDATHQGQVNGAMAPRSPGSALKPFIYALAFEHGLTSPAGLVYDVPVDYAGYQPVNYDGTFNGAVSAASALIRSLNVPAVNLYAQLGDQGLYGFLKQASITTLPEAKAHYGLSLALGSGEVTLLELTNLYAGLANGGRFRPYRFTTATPTAEGDRLLSRGSAHLVTETLSNLARPDWPETWRRSVNLPKIAWKTGTSYGHRDAWSVGYTPQYTIGVWLGNFDGKGAPMLAGIQAAAPLLLDLFNAMTTETSNRWFTTPLAVETRSVCAVSGMVASPFCAAVKEESFLPGRSPHQLCSVHREVWVDVASGHRLCPHCRAGKDYQAHVLAHWPTAIATWMQRNGFPVEAIPQHNPFCATVASGEGPLIVSPPPDAEYKIRPDVSRDYQKILLDASVSNQTQTVYWFVDKQLIFKGDPQERVFITPEPGQHTILCMDDEGRTSEVMVRIR